MKRFLMLAVLSLISLGFGCSGDRSSDYAKRRPDPNDLSKNDRGLQSTDVIQVTDKIIEELMALPELNQSATQWTIVLDKVDNKTQSPEFNYDIFLQRLRPLISKHGRGRVALIANKAKFNELRDRELETRGDEFKQGSGASPTSPDAIQPDYALFATIMELPSNSTSYYNMAFELVNLKSRQIVFSRGADVKVLR